MKEVAVIGSASMVATRFCELAQEGLSLQKADYPEVDITNQESVDTFFKKDFEWAILFAAFTAVDEAEKERDNKQGKAWGLNVDGVANVVEACKKNGKKLLFFSTDFVFDGQNGPYNEDDPVAQNLAKVSWYGATKIQGERVVAQNLQDYIILRISNPFSGKKHDKPNFARNILTNYREGELKPQYTDQTFTPTFIDDIAPAIALLLEKDARGIYHVASTTTTTPYEFAKALLETVEGTTIGLEQGSIKQTLDKNKDATPRPTKGGLKVDRIISLGFTPTNWQDAISKFAKQYESD